MPDYDASGYDDWSFSEQSMWDDFLSRNPTVENDREAEAYYHLGYFSEELSPQDHQIMQDALINYLNDTYEIDWDQEFDWEAYREWYG